MRWWYGHQLAELCAGNPDRQGELLDWFLEATDPVVAS